MPNMKLIWLKTKELQSYKVDFSWQSIMRPLVIGSTSYHRKDLFLSRLPLIIRSTSYHRRDLLSSERPLVIESTSYRREYLLSSERPVIIRKTSRHQQYILSSEFFKTSYHWRDLFLSETPLVIESTSCYRKAFLSDRERHSPGFESVWCTFCASANGRCEDRAHPKNCKCDMHLEMGDAKEYSPCQKVINCKQNHCTSSCFVHVYRIFVLVYQIM